MTEAAAGRRVTFSDVLADREFRALYVAQALSVVGDQLARIAVALLVFARSHSPLLTALAYAVTYLPWLVGGPLLSVYADRMPRQRVMVACDLARAVIVLGLAVPHVPLPLAFLVVAAVSVLEPPFRAARSAVVPDIFPDERRYVVAASLTSTTSQLGQVLGFAAGGVLVAGISARGAIAIDSVTFVLSAVLIGARVGDRRDSRPDPTGTWRAIAEGSRFVWHQKRLRDFILIAWALVAAAIVPEALAVPYSAAHGGGAATAGLLTAALPCGAVVGAVVIGRVLRPSTGERLMAPMALATPALLALTAFNPPSAIAGLLWFVAGATSAAVVTFNRLLVRQTPAAMRGRVIGLAGTGLAVVQGAAAVLAGWIAEMITPAIAVADVALPMLAVLVVISSRWSASRQPVSRPKTAENNQRAEEATISEVAHPRPEPRMWAMSAAMACLGAGGVLLLRGDSPITNVGVPTWWFLLLFVVVQSAPLYFQFRKRRRAVQLESVPLVLGLFFLSPVSLVITRLAAVLLGQVFVRRQTALRTTFNLAGDALYTVITIAVFRALVPAHASVHASSWLAAIVALLCDDIVSASFVTVAGYFYEHSIRLKELGPPLSFSLGVTLVNTCLGLVTASAVSFDSSNAVAITVFVVLALAGFRTYHRLADRHAILDRLYAFAKNLGPMTSDPGEVAPALTQLRKLLRARELELAVLRGDNAATLITVYESDDRDAVRVSESILDDAWLDMIQPRRGALSDLWRVTFRRRRVSELTPEHMSVPVGSQESRVGVLRATGHAADGRVFDRNDLRLLEAVADQLGTALEKGRLIEGLREAATRDSLTGLANLDSLRAFLSAMLNEGSSGVLLLLDIDRFHDVNDTLGHDAGDGVLVEVAKRLEDAAAQGSLACRVGGDQFALIIPGHSSGELARLAALAVKSRVDGPLRLADVSADVRVTIGMARAPDHGDDATTLLRRAEIAMGSAKGGSSGISEWEPQMERDGSRRLYVLSGLRQALVDSDLHVEFQPKLKLGSGAVTGFEALARWRHPDLGLVSPAEFIPLAEATGLVGALTSTVLRLALETCRRWHDLGKAVSVAVNISARSLDDPVLVGQVAALLTASGLESRWLTLEITESSVMQNPNRSMEVLRQLRSLGVHLAIDDFGTGYSSLHYLRGLPVHEVKIDKTFVDNIDHDGADRAVVRAVVEMCSSLRLTTVAEGVEQASQAYALEALGVEEVQGFFYGRPMPEADATAWLNSRSVADEFTPERQRG